jgi:hypothetical protein
MKKTAQKKPPPLREAMSIRFTAEEKVAILAAGETEEREPSVLVRRIVVAWLKAEGFLK